MPGSQSLGRASNPNVSKHGFQTAYLGCGYGSWIIGVEKLFTVLGSGTDLLQRFVWNGHLSVVLW